MKYYLTSNTWGKEEVNSVKKVLSSGRYTYGKNVELFEKKFANFHKKKYAVMVNSGSSANLIALSILKYLKKNPLKQNDEIIVPGISWSTTYFPINQAGFKIVLVDVNSQTLNIDVEKIEKAITKKTKAIMTVSILGNSCDFLKIKQLCKKHNLLLIEDNCESLGATHKTKLTGTFGDISTFSFFFSHHISTGEGGMVITDNFEYFNLLKSLRSHGWSRGLDEKYLKTISKNKFYEDYEFLYPGYNLRPMEFNAVTGIEQLKKLRQNIKLRRNNLKIFQNLMADNDIFDIQKEYGESSSFSFPLILKNKYKKHKNKIYKYLKKKNIEFRLLTGGCIACHPVIKKLNYRISGNLNKSIYAHKYGLFIGNHPKNLKKEITYFSKVIKSIKI